MRTSAKLTALVASALLFVTTNSASAQKGPGLEVSDPQWGGRQNAVVTMPHNIPVDRGQAANNPPATEISALFRNTGQKIIKSVTWKYIFYRDEARTEVLASYSFHNDKRIASGASVRLKKNVFLSFGPREWSNYQGVEIVRV